jgi:hypothetical protein
MSDIRKPVSGFEDLEVFQRAYRAALEVHRVSLELPAIEQRVLADQLRRASRSICGNIAEGFGKQRRSTAEVQLLFGHCDRLGRRDAGLDQARARSRLHRRAAMAAVARRVSGDRAHAAGPGRCLVEASFFF